MPPAVWDRYRVLTKHSSPGPSPQSATFPQINICGKFSSRSPQLVLGIDLVVVGDKLGRIGPFSLGNGYLRGLSYGDSKPYTNASLPMETEKQRTYYGKLCTIKRFCLDAVLLPCCYATLHSTLQQYTETNTSSSHTPLSNISNRKFVIRHLSSIYNVPSHFQMLANRKSGLSYSTVHSTMCSCLFLFLMP